MNHCKRICFACFAAMGVALVLASTATAAHIPPGAVLDLRADVGVVTDPNDDVITWVDQSGNNNDFIGACR